MGRGDAVKGRRGDGENSELEVELMKLTPDPRISASPHPCFPASPRPRISASPHPRISASPHPISASPRHLLSLLVALSLFSVSSTAVGQKKPPQSRTTQSSHAREPMSPEAREMVERAIDVACTERKRDPQGSVPIDDMQGRPSLPVQNPEALAGALRAQRLLPVAKTLVIKSLNQLATEYRFSSRTSRLRLQQSIRRVESVRRIRPDMDSRDNASVLLRNPATITFGTIFLAGLPSDEAMISVLGHELVHIADGDRDSLRVLFGAIGNSASALTGLSIREQKAEELTCDLIGALAVREFVADSPGYDPIARRIARAVAHNCVAEDEGDEDHLSPRNTIRALLALNPTLTRELVYNREERVRPRAPRTN